MNRPPISTTLARLWEALTSWLGIGIGIVIADATLEATGNKPLRTNQPKDQKQTETGNTGTETNNQETEQTQ